MPLDLRAIKERYATLVDGDPEDMTSEETLDNLQRCGAGYLEDIPELVREVESLTEKWRAAADYNGRMDDQVMRAFRERDAARAEVESLRALLRGVEWSGAPYRPGEPEAEAFRSTCPTCGGVRGPWPSRSPIADIEGHVPGCRLASAIREEP